MRTTRIQASSDTTGLGLSIDIFWGSRRNKKRRNRFFSDPLSPLILEVMCMSLIQIMIEYKSLTVSVEILLQNWEVEVTRRKKFDDPLSNY